MNTYFIFILLLPFIQSTNTFLRFYAKHLHSHHKKIRRPLHTLQKHLHLFIIQLNTNFTEDDKFIIQSIFDLLI